MNTTSADVRSSVPLTRELDRVPAAILVPRFAAMDLREAARRLVRTVRRKSPVVIEEAELEPPDSRICREAADLLRSSSPEFLTNHSLRSYFFAYALAKADEKPVDREVLFVAAALHDLGLTDRAAGSRSFELEGASVARDFCLSRGLPAPQADIVHEAIALHAAVGIASRHQFPEVTFVHLGAGLDLLGLRRREIAPRTLEAIMARAPRIGFKREFDRLLSDQARTRPQSHIAGLVKLGLRRRLQSGPFAE